MDVGQHLQASMPAANMKHLLRDIKRLEAANLEESGITVTINEENVMQIDTEYAGPEGTPYEGGSFRMRLTIDADYPNVPPKGRFLTKIFHPNVSTSGDVCVNVLKRDWKPDIGLAHILTVIRCLLVEPNAESALNEEAGMLLLEGFEEFASKARMMTEVHVLTEVNSSAPGGSGSSGDGMAGRKAKVESSHRGVGKKPKVVDMKKKSLRRL
jgi:ubiquitin-conjugating enzyme E2 S